MLPVKSSDPRLAYVGVKIRSDDGHKQLTEDDLGKKALDSRVFSRVGHAPIFADAHH